MSQDEAGRKRDGGEGLDQGFGELTSLRRILVGPLQEELEELGELARRELEPKDVGRVLPEAFLLRQRQDSRLAEALAPTMESALKRSIERNPKALADALFPVMGPAIRRSIQHTLSAMLAGLNTTLEHGLSPRGLRWRLEAWRTGRSFAEVVLLKSLVYRVEQVFLIHGETGLLLEHVEHPGLGGTDPEMVSAMLSAIASFVGDSFARTKARRTLETVAFDEGVLQLATGPHALLAVLVRGAPPSGLRLKLEQTLERLHAELWQELAEFDGDPTPFFAARERLEGCLGEKRAGDEGPARAPRRVTAAHLVLGSLALVLLAWLGLELRARSRWRRALALVQAEPGLFVVQSERRMGRDRLDLLRDPEARDPLAVLAEAGVAADDVVVRSWPVRSLEPALLLAHARRLLAPPAGVVLRLEGARLVVDGYVDEAWLARSRTLSSQLQGIDEVVPNDAVTPR